MAATTTTNGNGNARAPTTISFDEPELRKNSVFSTSSEEEDPDHPTHKQDWTQTTTEADSWATRERRRSSIFAHYDSSAPTHQPTKPTQGSILSIWQKGKDKDGNDILIHEGHDHDGPEHEVLIVEQAPVPVDAFGVPKERRSLSGGQDRRGSVLGLWSTGGKDKKGNDIIHHHDEEWSEEEPEEEVQKVVEPPKPEPIDLTQLSEKERLRVEELVRLMRSGAVV